MSNSGPEHAGARLGSRSPGRVNVLSKVRVQGLVREEGVWGIVLIFEGQDIAGVNCPEVKGVADIAGLVVETKAIRRGGAIDQQLDLIVQENPALAGEITNDVAVCRGGE